MIDVLGPEKRRRRTTQEKIAIVQQSFEPGMTVSLVARQHGVAASQLFLWRKQYQEGSLTAVAAGEQVVPASELAAAMKQIKELQRLLGKKTMENELLKEAVEYGRARQHGVAASQLFLWRKQYQEGSLTAVAAGEQVVPASELAAAMKQIKELQRLLGKKTMENELLKEAVEYGRAKKWIAHAPLLPGDGE